MNEIEIIEKYEKIKESIKEFDLSIVFFNDKFMIEPKFAHQNIKCYFENLNEVEIFLNGFAFNKMINDPRVTPLLIFQ